MTPTHNLTSMSFSLLPLSVLSNNTQLNNIASAPLPFWFWDSSCLLNVAFFFIHWCCVFFPASRLLLLWRGQAQEQAVVVHVPNQIHTAIHDNTVSRTRCHHRVCSFKSSMCTPMLLFAAAAAAAAGIGCGCGCGLGVRCRLCWWLWFALHGLLLTTNDSPKHWRDILHFCSACRGPTMRLPAGVAALGGVGAVSVDSNEQVAFQSRTASHTHIHTHIHTHAHTYTHTRNSKAMRWRKRRRKRKGRRREEQQLSTRKVTGGRQSCPAILPLDSLTFERGEGKVKPCSHRGCVEIQARPQPTRYSKCNRAKGGGGESDLKSCCNSSSSSG